VLFPRSKELNRKLKGFVDWDMTPRSTGFSEENAAYIFRVEE
jgi:hypothetical protein